MKTHGRGITRVVDCLGPRVSDGALILAIALGVVVTAPFKANVPLLDFGSFVASGRAAAAGGNPYGVYPLTFKVEFAGAMYPSPNLNPPVSILLLQAIAGHDPASLFRAWYVIGAVLYVVVVVSLLRAFADVGTGRRFLWSVALAGFWDTVGLGQLYVPLLLAGAGAWLLLRARSSLLAGVLIGTLVAVKPNFLVWPMVLFLAGYVTVALAAGITAAGLSAIPLLVYGPAIYREWLAVAMTRGATILPTDASLTGAAARLGAPVVGSALSAVLLVGVAAWAWRRRPAALDASAFALLAVLLASPFAWDGYTILLLPVFLSRRWSPLLTASAALLCVPSWIVWSVTSLSPLVLATLGSTYCGALLMGLLALTTNRSADGVASGQVFGGDDHVENGEDEGNDQEGVEPGRGDADDKASEQPGNDEDGDERPGQPNHRLASNVLR